MILADSQKQSGLCRTARSAVQSLEVTKMEGGALRRLTNVRLSSHARARGARPSSCARGNFSRRHRLPFRQFAEPAQGNGGLGVVDFVAAVKRADSNALKSGSLD